MASLLQSLSTQYSKPAAGQRVTFAAGAEKNTATPENTLDEIQHVSGALQEEGHRTETQISELSQVVEEREPEEGRTEGEQKHEEQMPEFVLSNRKSFLRPAIASLCARCIATVVRKQSIEHCTLLCVALELYREAETVVKVHEEYHTRFPSGQSDRTESKGGSKDGGVESGRGDTRKEGEGEKGKEGQGDRRKEGKENGQEEGEGERRKEREGDTGEEGKGEWGKRVNGDREEKKEGGRGEEVAVGEGGGVKQSVTEVVSYLSGCLLRAIDDSSN